jgi:ketosteroid isomerase-like protein
MRGHVSITLVFVGIGTLVSLYLGCTTPQNTNTNTVVLASPEPTPDRAAIEVELTRIENDWPRIIKERDSAAVKKIEADDILLVYPDGASGNKDQDIKDIEAGSLTADSWELSDVVVRVIDNDAAVVTLRTTVKAGKYKMPDGKTQDVSGQYRSMDTFARRNGQWQLVASATVPVRNPTPTTAASPAARPSPSVRPSPAARTSPAMKTTPAMKSSPKAATSPT